jgi:hypothetical protein
VLTGAVDRIIESAHRLGVELDRDEAEQWLSAMALEAQGGDVIVDVDSGVYGHRVTMLDFQPRDLERFRRIGRIVGFEDRPGVQTALALSGSAAQSKIQTYPGDADFFERVHIQAADRDEAVRILADVIREKALSTLRGETHRLWEVKFGTWPEDVVHRGKAERAGSVISWAPTDVEAGEIRAERPDGTPIAVRWEDAPRKDAGWCKLDWVVADPQRGQLANASNVLDVTWESPDGTVTPLDGFIDPYYQEVYLEAESLPVFTKLVKKLSGDAVDEYVSQLEHEVWKYTVKEQNYGKAARRMYNVFRLTGRYHEAAFIRELFDEPATALYQVAALIRTLDEAAEPGHTFSVDAMLQQADALIMSAIAALEGETEMEMVRNLLSVRDSIQRAEADATEREPRVEGVRTAALAAVNEYFRHKLEAVPEIREYLKSIAQREAAAAG